MKILLAGPFATDPFRAALGLVLAGAPPGVIQTPIGALGAELVRRGHQVTAVTHDESVSAPVRVAEGALELVYLPLRHRASKRALDLFREETASVLAEIERVAPDVAHGHWTYEYAEAVVRGRCPHVVTMHDVPVEIAWLFKNGYRVLRAAMAYRVMPRIRSLAVVSPRMAPWARAHGYLGPIAAVPNGVNIPGQARARATPFSGEGPVIGMVGDLSARKNIATGLAAFRLLRERFPGAALHLCGRGLDAAYAAGEPGVTGHGPTPHPRLMAFLAERADLLVHPSRQETFGVVLAEAMVRRVPVVAGAQSGGVRLVVGKELDHLLVDVRSPEAIFAKCAALLNDAAFYRHVADAAETRIRAEFSDQIMTTRYLDLYQQALSRQTRSRPSAP